MLTFFKSIFLAFATLMIFGCSSSAEDKKVNVSEETQEIQQSGPEYTSAYICPMHCEGSGSAEPGKCPVCGMDYVAKENK